MMQIHNSLSGRKEPLETLEPGHVRMYVCGMTVYDFCHLGHARAMVVFDMVARYLRAVGWRVTMVRNVTDIDDKIIKRAAETGTDPDSIARTYTTAMHEDTEALGLAPPDAEPRATAHIGEIIAMIERLVAGGYGYAPGNGDVYFDISRFASYGRLSGKRLADLRAGERVAVDEAKDDSLDFVLWKAAKPGEPAWDSPWGRGRPGWHIECSAMSTHCLGDTFDIHGGGMDLKFPHHENEIAQSEAATGHPFVRYWMHNGFVTIDDEKMAKSLGNFLTIRDVLAVHRAETVRYFILNSHYRSPLAYSGPQLDAAASALSRLYQALRGHAPATPATDTEFEERFHAAMADDFNTPEALAVLFQLAKEINRLRQNDPGKAAELAALMVQLGDAVGLLQEDVEGYFKRAPKKGVNVTAGQGLAKARGYAPILSGDFSDAEVDELVAERKQAREQRDFAEADRIRDELAAAGVTLEDGPQGTTWRRTD